MGIEVEVKSNGTVLPKRGRNNRSLYQHQKDAMSNLDIINEQPAYSTLVVLPTGSGKTYTASLWLLRHALNNQKKILWIAHRQMLLDQAAESFQYYAYVQSIPSISSFNYRIVSGSSTHDRTIDILPTDNLLVASKDSLGRSLERLDAWLDGEKEVFLIIDEAHHATAKSYRKIIEYVDRKVPNVKLIGLTATPFRTAENEQGLLAKIFKDGIKNGRIVGSGIAYQIGLKELINKQILSRPIFESYYSDEIIGGKLGTKDLEKLLQMDVLPTDIVDQLKDSAPRNNLIVETYKKKQKVYGQTIVFAVSVLHAIALAGLFNKAGISAEYVVSDIKDQVTGVTVSREDNERKIESYRQGKTRVLVNVNILTEGVDLPQTETVFLTRPTVSTILMTQMIGRALRGEAAGGTKEAYIVSFIDKWNDYISWVSPESLFIDDAPIIDNKSEKTAYEMRLIAISKIEEFAKMLDESIDTYELEKVPFKKRIPIGMYAFTCLGENGIDPSYQVMVYDSTQKAYQDMMDNLEELAKDADINEDGYLQKDELEELADQCRDTFFTGEMVPPYEDRDVRHILQYYAQYNEAPPFYPFDDIDKGKLNVAAIAKDIWDEDMGQRREKEYVDALWDDVDDNLLKVFFSRKEVFLHQLEIEKNKLAHPELYENEKNVKYGRKDIEDMPLYSIRKYAPDYEKTLRDGAFKAAMDEKGYYVCDNCGMRSKSRVRFHVDHIKAMNKGGKSVSENLHILCRSCNMKKGDK